MLNTHRIALAGAVALLSTAASGQTPCAVDPGAAHAVSLPQELAGAATKLRTAPLFTPGVHEFLALVGTRLILIRDAMSAPRPLVIAEDVRDFCVIPASGGRSAVAIVGDAGLLLSTPIELASPDEGQTLIFESVDAEAGWNHATRIEAAGPSQGVHLVACFENEVLHGLLEANGALVKLPTIDAGDFVSHLAVADAHSRSGAEIAVGMGSRIDLYFESYGHSEPVVPYLSVYAVSNGFTHLSRVPLGADVRDSFGVNQTTAATDIFYEIAGTAVSDPIYGAHVRVNDVAFAPMGISFNPLVTLQTDMAIATDAGELVALHGVPQGAPGIPFVFDFAQISAVSVSTLLGGASVADLRVACGDLDGDGDGDFGLANNYGGVASFVFLRNDCSTREPVGQPIIAVAVDTTGMAGDGNWSEEVGVIADLQVRQPPIFEGLVPTHVRVKVYVREFYVGLPSEEQEPVSPAVWFEADLDAEPDTSTNPPAPFKALLTIPISSELPFSLASPYAQLNTGNALLYFELVPMRKNPVNGEVIQRANATVWVGSENEALLRHLICDADPDEFSDLYDCGATTGEDGGQLITEVHRRKVIRPIPPTTAPQ